MREPFGTSGQRRFSFICRSQKVHASSNGNYS